MRKFNFGLVIIGLGFSVISFARYWYGIGLVGFTDPDKAVAYGLVGFVLVLVSLVREKIEENSEKIKENDEAIFKIESYIEDKERRKKWMDGKLQR